MNNEIIDTLRSSLQPKGAQPVVRMSLTNPYFQSNFIESCIADLEKKMITIQAGLDNLSPLERLGIYLLFDSADIKSSR